MALIAESVAGRTPPELYQDYLGPVFEKWADVVLESAPPSGSVLDIACGTGVVSRALAARDGVERVCAFDVAGGMVEKARALTGAESAVEFQVASAHDIPYPDNFFQAAYCQQGLQFFPDKPASMKEAGRVVVPGGRIAYAVWTFAKDGNPFFDAFENIVARDFGEDLVPFGPFSFGDAGALEKVANDAGMKVVSLKREERACLLPDLRSLVLFDLLFLGRPGPDGALQPLFDPNDGSKDPQIEKLIRDLDGATLTLRQPDGTTVAPFTSNLLVVEAPD